MFMLFSQIFPKRRTDRSFSCTQLLKIFADRFRHTVLIQIDAEYILILQNRPENVFYFVPHAKYDFLQMRTYFVKQRVGTERKRIPVIVYCH